MNTSYEIIKFIYLFTLVFALNFYTDEMVFYEKKKSKAFILCKPENVYHQYS